MSLTMNDLRRKFPREGNNIAETGNIPMDYFDRNESAIRAAMKSELGFSRVQYRGARINNEGFKRTNTMRRDALSVKLYKIG